MADLAATLRDQRRQTAMSEIANVALQLFLDKGFGETSVDDIAAAAGCSPRTFYRYFGTKEDVMFHDLPAMIDRLDEILEEHLANGVPYWDAITESLVALVGRFDQATPTTVVARMNLWMTEPPLQTRYIQYVVAAESKVRDRLGNYLEPGSDLGALMAVVAIGAYRVTIFTHSLLTPGELSSHLRRSLGIVGAAFANESKRRRSGR